MEYELTQYDKDFIARLYEIDGKILDLYNKMADLEIKGVDFLDEEFQKLICELKSLISIENSIINLETFTLPRFNVLRAYNFDLEIDNIESGEINSSMNRITNILLTERDKLKKDKDSVIRNAIESDITELALYFTNKLLKEPRYQIYRNNIIRHLKYYGMFIDKKAETEHIENNFNIPEEFYISSELIREYLKIDNKTFTNIKLNIISSKVLFYSMLIAKTQDEIFEGDKNFVALLHAKCYLKALFVMIPEELVLDMNNSILAQETSKNSKSYIFLKETLEESLEDRKRINNVSFGRNRS